jgi:hypothetical protein
MSNPRFDRRPPIDRNKIHPAWTGIGCLMILIVPIMSGAAALELVKLARAQGWPMMNDLSGYARLPDVFYTLPVISLAANYISSIPDFWGVALFFLITLLILSGILSFGYAVTYRMIGPPRYLPNDEPAPRVKLKKYTR